MSELTHKKYWDEVRATAEWIADTRPLFAGGEGFVSEGYDARDPYDALHERIDGHEYIIYTHKARTVLALTGNWDAYQFQYGDAPKDEHVQAFAAMIADIHDDAQDGPDLEETCADLVDALCKGSTAGLLKHVIENGNTYYNGGGFNPAEVALDRFHYIKNGGRETFFHLEKGSDFGVDLTFEAVGLGTNNPDGSHLTRVRVTLNLESIADFVWSHCDDPTSDKFTEFLEEHGNEATHELLVQFQKDGKTPCRVGSALSPELEQWVGDNPERRALALA